MKIPFKNIGKSSTFFLIVKRGGCHFDEKAKYAQKAGAEVLLVVDNKEESVHDIIVTEEDKNKSEV